MECCGFKPVTPGRNRIGGLFSTGFGLYNSSLTVTPSEAEIS